VYNITRGVSCAALALVTATWQSVAKWVLGIEPVSSCELTLDSGLLASNVKHPRAARALDPGSPKCHCLSSFDPDLQRVIAA
jgi:hypothetical protein